MDAIRSTTYQVHYANPRRVRVYDADEVEARIRSGDIGADDRISLAGGPQKQFWEHPRFAELKPDTGDDVGGAKKMRPRKVTPASAAIDLSGLKRDGASRPTSETRARGRSDSTLQQKRGRRRAPPAESALPNDAAPPVNPAERRAAAEDDALPDREHNEAGFDAEDSARRADAIRRRFGTDPQRNAVRSDAYRRVGTGQRRSVSTPVDPERVAKQRRSRELIEQARRRQASSDDNSEASASPDTPPRKAVAGRPRRAASTPRGQAAVFDRAATSGSHPIVSSDFDRTPSGRHKHVSGIQSALDPRAAVEPTPFPERLLDGGMHGLRDHLQTLPLPEILGVAYMTPRPLITKAYHRRCQHVDELWESLLPEVRSTPVKVDILRILQMAHETLTDPEQHREYGNAAHTGGQLAVFSEAFDFVSTETRLSGEHRTAADEMLEMAGFDLRKLYGDVDEQTRREREDAEKRKRSSVTPYQKRIRAYTVLIVISAALAAWSLSKGC